MMTCFSELEVVEQANSQVDTAWVVLTAVQVQLVQVVMPLVVVVLPAAVVVAVAAAACTHQHEAATPAAAIVVDAAAAAVGPIAWHQCCCCGDGHGIEQAEKQTSRNRCCCSVYDDASCDDGTNENEMAIAADSRATPAAAQWAVSSLQVHPFSCDANVYHAAFAASFALHQTSHHVCCWSCSGDDAM